MGKTLQVFYLPKPQGVSDNLFCKETCNKRCKEFIKNVTVPLKAQSF
jgi:hypothetical protein